MRHSFLLLLGLVATAAPLGACGRTTFHTPPDVVAACDGEVCVTPPDATDAPEPDAPEPDAPGDARVARCGDGVLDPRESCDDGNNADGDGCSAACRWEARCGDGTVDPGEVCDDGNNGSGDGCRSDCRSDERCGNGVVDTAVGELCDGTPGCAPDCRRVVGCGDGVVGPGEQCDDGNAARWDGCAPDCRVEQGLGLNAFFIAPDNGRLGCDFSGDRRPDNAFARGLGPAAGILNTAITNGISNGRLLLQLAFLGLDDRLGVDDPDLRVGWLTGQDADDDSLNNGHPGNPQRVDSAALDERALPRANYQSAIAMRALGGGPEDITLNLPGPNGMPFRFRLTRSRLSGTLAHDDTRIARLSDGVLCGAIPTGDLARLPNYFAAGGGRMPRSSLLEAIVGGYRFTVPFGPTFMVGPTQPDVDVDGDGLERYEARGGSDSREPEITACIDGDGTRVPGRSCALDPRFADAFSSAFQLNGVWIRFVGAGGM